MSTGSIWILPAEAISPAARLAAEDFLVAEAALLDDRMFDEWLALFTDDLEYIVPVRTIRRRGNGSDVDWESRHYDDDKASMSLRVRRLTETDVAWAEDPPSFTRRVIGNFRYTPGPGETELTVKTNLLLFRSRGISGQHDLIAGERTDVLRLVDGQLKIAKRHVVLDQATLGTKNLGVFL
ncbi:aromatic-ring-hydroxylating dioxygenase subunit beta [Conexibacter stalactiti]|uniref:Aromatic-ring-hydroxylating dioxygenase subunit beta n=1 Tax=Conexibacter stalactiti TaxID=1940611 RepID=A0ABU4HU94_9ACTN|nr:aromatic-ring-hydroxylating dioxygenase subunit beta [Conexibacter stalactiti]MDW5596881.1 aromatic-ring-hydroxylating dioxygenase subunit beta [Conexibacter stalactiti]MEC5037523.1 aromatic-ring-hydroxylating dioxygenase subunit beta [Conexibacter stalactiti]